MGIYSTDNLANHNKIIQGNKFYRIRRNSILLFIFKQILILTKSSSSSAK